MSNACSLIYSTLTLTLRRGLRSRNNRVRTDAQKATIQECRNILTRSMLKLRTAQAVYMPGVFVLIGENGPPSQDTESDKSCSIFPESIPLFLPSQLSTSQRGAMCTPGLQHKELHLRYAQANDTLHDLRRMFIGMVDRHKKQSLGTGTKANTRVNTVLRGFKARIMRAADCYRAARAAMDVLDPVEAGVYV